MGDKVTNSGINVPDETESASKTEKLNVVHLPTFDVGEYRELFQNDSLRLVSVDSLRAFAPVNGSLNVVLIDPSVPASDLARLDGTRTVAIAIGVPPGTVPQEKVVAYLPASPAAGDLRNAIRGAYHQLRERIRVDGLQQQLTARTRELEQLNQIGIALSALRDHDALLEMILSKARELSRSDAGSLYLLDQEPGIGRVLRWKLAQNDSIDVDDFEEMVLPVTKKSLAGYVALTGEMLVIDDAYHLPDDVEYSTNTSFDEQSGYLTRSILVFPMMNHDGDPIGVLQLINRKGADAPERLTAKDVPEHVISFDEHTIRLMQSLAGQAAVAVENNLLYESIERLFEGFVTASVTAIEQRDPTTSGHSFRVADMTVALAKQLDRIDQGLFAEVRFSPEQIKEIRYASLLHDFGKVGVREKILVKEKKLYSHQIDLIRARFDFVVRSAESARDKKKFDYVMRHGFDGFEGFAAKIDEETTAEIARLKSEFALILHANEPTVLPEGDFDHLQEIAEQTYTNLEGTTRPMLTPHEVKALSIRKGNLDALERDEIESHVTHTFMFLTKIPWTKDLRNVPEIAYAHHEKLNGRGYPRRLGSPQIPIQSRMMTVSDIYDALTANDRPYKRAISTERALDILHAETKEGLLDQPLVDIFIEAKIFEEAKHHLY
jgi:HD-GYP domain-containing protein (c-di-GMP phosphodiesterase class II)